AVSRQDEGDDLRFLTIALLEGRTEGTVDEAGGEDFFLGRTSFALEEASRDAPAGVGVLLVVDGEGHEVAHDSAVFEAGRGKDDRVAVSDYARAVGLFGDRTCLHGQGF